MSVKRFPTEVAEERRRLAEVADLLRQLRHQLEFADDLTPLAANPEVLDDAETVWAILSGEGLIP